MNSETLKYANAAEANLWRYVTGLLVGVQTITPLYYNGLSVGTEYLTYSAKKLYIALDFIAYYASGTPMLAAALVTFHDQNDAISSYGYKSYPVWETVVPEMRVSNHEYKAQNFFFSRIELSTYSRIRFNGYKITIP